MITIKWNTNTFLECIDKDGNDWCESIDAGEEFDVENITIICEDEENGDMVNIEVEDGIVASSNSNWFSIID